MAENKIVLPKWYKSTRGPAISKTVLNISGTALPVLNLVLANYDIVILPDAINLIVTLGVFLWFAAQAAVGYIQSKKALMAEIIKLGGSVN
jgi:hypothetical protein